MNIFRKKSAKKILDDAKKGYSDGEELLEMNKVLGVNDITILGLAAIIGAGIFSTVGQACFDGGPAVSLLFVGIAVACGFSALCYAEMASRLPVSGSAYTYTYNTFGEIFAWIIGWDLIMEYAVGNITVAISWSGNLTTFLEQLGVHLPAYLTHGFMEAKNGFQSVISAQATGHTPSVFHQEMFNLWQSAPELGGLKIILNLPAFFIAVVVTYLVYLGIKESRKMANFMVIFKIFVVLMIIAIGAFYVKPDNWSPFAPNGMTGVLKGVAAVFFAYIGFDALATVAEECKDPQRDLPRGMIRSLIIATVLYILVALVLTGMVHYTSLNDEAFLANTFIQRGLNFMGGLIAFSALIATASVFLVFQIGQPRIWMSMSRDGLLPVRFSRIHRKYKTPYFATFMAGVLVAIPSLFMDAAFVTDMTSIGTLFAFALVCGGVLILHLRKTTQEDELPKFRVPCINAQYIFPLIYIAVVIGLLLSIDKSGSYAHTLLYGDADFVSMLPTYLFWIILTVLAFLSYTKRLSLIPLLGMSFCLYFLSTLDHVNWTRFLIWLAIGLVIYFFYSRNHSKLAHNVM